MSDGTFGHHIGSDLVKQIKVREEMFGKGFKQGSGKTDSEMVQLYGNAPWVMLRSSVNELSDSEVRVDTNQSANTSSERVEISGLPGGSASNAKIYTLVGGQTGNRAGIENWTGNIPAYKLDSTFGYKPIPGITHVSVKTKDTWGMIMEANIEVTIWSRTDIEIMDKLYFRPGMTALLEWGHTNWYDEKKAAHQSGLSSVVSNSEFFKSNTMTNIETLVNEKRKAGQGNYEGMFGYITNFSWSFNDNGSYSATIRLLSKGAVLEGLQIQSPGQSCKDEDSKTDDRSGTTSVYHRAFLQLNRELDDGHTEHTWYYNNVSFEHVITQRIELVRSGFLGIGFLKANDKVNLSWIRFGDFLKLIANEGGISDGLGNIFPRFDFDTEYKYITFQEHFSLNPYVAYKPENAYVFSLKEKAYNSIVVPSQLSNSDYISNIMISTNFIMDTVESIISQKQKFSSKELIETVLEEIQKAFGNINDFSLYFNYDNGTYAVVDHNNPSDPDNPNEEVGRISITGTDTTVRNLKVTSELSSDLANEMSIAAAAPAANSDGVDRLAAHPSLIYWNKGLVNRHVAETIYLQNDSSRVEMIDTPGVPIVYGKKAYIDFYDKATNFYKKILATKIDEGNDVNIDNSYSLESFTEIQTSGEEIFKRFLEWYANYFGMHTQESGNLQMGVIPIKVEMTMMGIGRFIIGTSFMVNGQGGTCILPTQYQNWGWIVTGVEHDISSAGWTTTLRTQYYPVLKNITTNGRGKHSNTTSNRANSGSSTPGTETTGTGHWTYYHFQPTSRVSNFSTFYTKYWNKRADWLQTSTRGRAIVSSGKYSAKTRTGETSGICALGTYQAAFCYVKGLNNVLPQTAGGNANQLTYRRALERIGYMQVDSKVCSKVELMKLLGGANFEQGDVVIYFSDNGVKYHTQMYAGNAVSSEWMTDNKDNYGCSFVYPRYNY